MFILCCRSSHDFIHYSRPAASMFSSVSLLESMKLTRLVLAFESVIHMGEEIRNPKVAVPRAVFWALVGNMTLALIMLVTFVVCKPSLEIFLEAESPLVTILLNSAGSTKAMTAMVCGLVIPCISSNMGIVSSVSLLSWVRARDGGQYSPCPTVCRLWCLTRVVGQADQNTSATSTPSAECPSAPSLSWSCSSCCFHC